MLRKEVPIGRAADETGVKVPTIRYYEQIGLLPGPARSGSNRRLYGEQDLNRLRFIRHARELGFEVDAIRTLLRLAGDPERPCGEADVIARARLADIDNRITGLSALRKEVARMVQECTQATIGKCRVIEVLSDHGKCLAHHGRPFDSRVGLGSCGDAGSPSERGIVPAQ